MSSAASLTQLNLTWPNLLYSLIPHDVYTAPIIHDHTHVLPYTEATIWSILWSITRCQLTGSCHCVLETGSVQRRASVQLACPCRSAPGRNDILQTTTCFVTIFATGLSDMSRETLRGLTSFLSRQCLSSLRFCLKFVNDEKTPIGLPSNSSWNLNHALQMSKTYLCTTWIPIRSQLELHRISWTVLHSVADTVSVSRKSSIQLSCIWRRQEVPYLWFWRSSHRVPIFFPRLHDSIKIIHANRVCRHDRTSQMSTSVSDQLTVTNSLIPLDVTEQIWDASQPVHLLCGSGISPNLSVIIFCLIWILFFQESNPTSLYVSIPYISSSPPFPWHIQKIWFHHSAQHTNIQFCWRPSKLLLLSDNTLNQHIYQSFLCAFCPVPSATTWVCWCIFSVWSETGIRCSLLETTIIVSICVIRSTMSSIVSLDLKAHVRRISLVAFLLRRVNCRFIVIRICLHFPAAVRDVQLLLRSKY